MVRTVKDGPSPQAEGWTGLHMVASLRISAWRPCQGMVSGFQRARMWSECVQVNGPSWSTMGYPLERPQKEAWNSGEESEALTLGIKLKGAPRRLSTMRSNSWCNAFKNQNECTKIQNELKYWHFKWRQTRMWTDLAILSHILKP